MMHLRLAQSRVKAVESLQDIGFDAALAGRHQG